MTRKDYVAFARMLAEAKGQIDEAARLWIASAMVSVFTADNDRFDRERFLTAADIAH